MTSVESAGVETRPNAAGVSAFGWEFGTLAVALFGTLPGVLCGALVRLCVPDGGPASWWLVAGASIAAILGGLLEADHLFG